LLARLLAWVIGFPRAGKEIPVTVSFRSRMVRTLEAHLRRPLVCGTQEPVAPLERPCASGSGRSTSAWHWCATKAASGW
jgi:hypothetical protein